MNGSGLALGSSLLENMHMKTVLLSAAAALALTVASAGSAFAGQVYGNYGGPTSGYGGPSYGPPPSYGPGYGPPRYAGSGGGYSGRSHYRRHCGGDRVAGTIIGGILGGVIGNNISGGRHRGPETAAGVIIGGIAGNAIAGSGCRHRGDHYDGRGDVYRGGAYGGYDPRYDDDYGPSYGPGYGPGYDDDASGPGYDDGYGYDDDAPYEDRPYDGR